MSLNIKDAAVHAQVRELSRLTGLSQVAAVREAVSRRLSEVSGAQRQQGDAVERRINATAAIQAGIRSRFGEANPAFRQKADAELYDEQGLFR